MRRRTHLDARSIGRRIRAARKARGWTMRQLAAKAGMSLGGVSAIESGHRTPCIRSAVAMALALRRKLDWLVLGKQARS